MEMIKTAALLLSIITLCGCTHITQVKQVEPDFTIRTTEDLFRSKQSYSLDFLTLESYTITENTPSVEIALFYEKKFNRFSALLIKTSNNLTIDSLSLNADGDIYKFNRTLPSEGIEYIIGDEKKVSEFHISNALLDKFSKARTVWVKAKTPRKTIQRVLSNGTESIIQVAFSQFLTRNELR